jgi:type II secretory pathway component PulJ
MTTGTRARRVEAAFTLMEALLALGVAAVVLAAISGVFYSAVRLREATTTALDTATPRHHALNLLRRDLRGVVPPGSSLAGDFRSGILDTGTQQGLGLQFPTTTGTLNDTTPWGDIQVVTYLLQEPSDRTRARGKDLIRTVTRNLLATVVLDTQQQWLLGDVQNLEFAFFTGTEWRETWDTGLSDTNLPNAVRVRIQLAVDDSVDIRTRQPLELIVPLPVQPRTAERANAEESSG